MLAYHFGTVSLKGNGDGVPFFNHTELLLVAGFDRRIENLFSFGGGLPFVEYSLQLSSRILDCVRMSKSSS